MKDTNWLITFLYVWNAASSSTESVGTDLSKASCSFVKWAIIDVNFKGSANLFLNSVESSI
jgi:hypothetical protein